MTKATTFSVVSFLLGALVGGFVLANPLQWGWLPGASTAEGSSTASRTGSQPRGSDDREILYWRSPMDPTVTSPVPSKDAMGMDFVPVYADEADAPAAGTVRIDPTFVQNIGMRSEPVLRRDIPFTIRTVGTLTYNDDAMTWVNTKYEGWVEDVAVNYVGESVTRGQRLFDIYSPALVTTQREFLQAAGYAERLGGSPYPEIADRARSLLRSSRERLRLWDITDGQVRELEESGEPRRTLSVVSPVDGIVVEKMDQALEGMHVRPGMNLYKLVDLSTMWVEVEIFEGQVPWLRVGQTARIELPYAPGRVYQGRIRFLFPFFNEATRTMKVSIELPNPDRMLRADMYANVTFDVPSAVGVLTVPEEAVIRSGTRDVVVLDRGQGSFEVAEVRLGVNGSGLWEVSDGIDEGDRIVVSAQFLIDSESSLKEAIRKVSAPNGAFEMDGGEAMPPPTGHQH